MCKSFNIQYPPPSGQRRDIQVPEVGVQGRGGRQDYAPPMAITGDKDKDHGSSHCITAAHVLDLHKSSDQSITVDKLALDFRLYNYTYMAQNRALGFTGSCMADQTLLAFRDLGLTDEFLAVGCPVRVLWWGILQESGKLLSCYACTVYTSSEFSVYSLQNTNYKIVAHLEEVESEDKSNTRRRKTKRRLRLGHLGRHP